MRKEFVVRLLLVLVADVRRGNAVGVRFDTRSAERSLGRPARDANGPDGRADEGPVLAVTASTPGGAGTAGALAELAALALRAEGVRARAVPPPGACRPPHAADARPCREATFARLARGELHVALLAAPAARAPGAAWPLRDAGLDDLGDATPPARRTCAAPPPARSLLDLVDEDVAREYRVPPERLLGLPADGSAPGRNASVAFEPPWCAGVRARCATLLTTDEGDATVLANAVRARRLRATVAVGRAAPAEPHVACGWASRPEGPAPLGPPPCDLDADADECPFESRRTVKLVNAREVGRSHRALRALVRLRLDAVRLAELARLARSLGPAGAAARFAAVHHGGAAARELRAAVLLPVATRREAFDGAALAAAAALAEADLEDDGESVARFRVEIFDARCDAGRAYRYLNDALNAREYETLSAMAGPACGAAFADAARTAAGPVHSLVALAYTAQAPPAGALALMAAGDAHEPAAALGALLARMRWRRVAALSEPGTRAALAAALAHAEPVAQLELAGGEAAPARALLAGWAGRVARARGRVLLVCVEDARAARAALCAGHAAGLTPAAGAVWLLPAALPAAALAPARDDACSAAQLEEMLDGHLSVAPEWALPWLEDSPEVTNVTDGNLAERPPSESATSQWEARWRARCRLLGVSCARPGPHAALLYDALRLWAGALRARRLPPDLHDARLARELLADATRANFVGLTGRFEWRPADAGEAGVAYARVSPLVVLQRQAGARRLVARWAGGRLALNQRALRWRTADGRAPDDGGEPCALRPLADLLRVDCSAAAAALGAALLALAVAAGAGAATCCRRRADRAYRARLEELGLQALLPRGVRLDRWELPRERVVINRKLGVGAFGTVYGGHALLAEGGAWTAVAVKTLKPGASTEEKLDFLSEAEAMKRFDHENVVRLLGVVTETEPVCAVMEFALYGDLKNYLLARRHLALPGAADAAEQVSARRLTALALDAARALSYLAQQRYVHRDVAARNCLVSARRRLKLADFGMSRPVFENDYYRFGRKGLLPVRWMAPESLARGVFSPASDVWSFGVLLYEIVTFGALPFQGLANGEVLARVKAGRTLRLPPGLKPQLEGLIKSCWKSDRRERPSASEVAAFLADWPRLLAPCLAVPLDALPLDEAWRGPQRWASWAAPASQGTDTTYLSAEPP